MDTLHTEPAQHEGTPAKPWRWRGIVRAQGKELEREFIRVVAEMLSEPGATWGQVKAEASRIALQYNIDSLSRLLHEAHVQVQGKTKPAAPAPAAKPAIARAPAKVIPLIVKDQLSAPVVHNVEIVPKTDDVPKWRAQLRFNQNNELTKDVHNAGLVLKNEPGFVGCLAFDSMAHRIVWKRVPDYRMEIGRPGLGDELADHHAVYVQGILAREFRLSVGKDVAFSAIEAAARGAEFHPVQEYLRSLKEWDGRPRLRNWLHVYLGADDTDYNAAVGRWWLISAVARAFRPGCQADHALILEGKQGEGKSQAIRVLGGDKWTLGSLPDVRDQPRAADAISGSWIVEIGELDAFKGAGMTRVKDFVTQQFDKYRPAYGRTTIQRARSCVFIGTTNETTYLTDPTGARRFWPVGVKTVDLEALRADRDQLWVEARNAFDADEQWHPDRSLQGQIEEQQEARQEPLHWLEKIRTWVDARGLNQTTAEQVLEECIEKHAGSWNRSDTMHVATWLKKLGFEHRKPWDPILKKQVRRWVLDVQTT